MSHVTRLVSHLVMSSPRLFPYSTMGCTAHSREGARGGAPLQGMQTVVRTPTWLDLCQIVSQLQSEEQRQSMMSWTDADDDGDIIHSSLIMSAGHCGNCGSCGNIDIDIGLGQSCAMHKRRRLWGQCLYAISCGYESISKSSCPAARLSIVDHG